VNGLARRELLLHLLQFGLVLRHQTVLQRGHCLCLPPHLLGCEYAMLRRKVNMRLNRDNLQKTACGF